MKLYAGVLFLSCFVYEIKSADVSLPSDKTVVLQGRLDAVKESQKAYFKAQAALSELLRLPIQPNNQKAMWDTMLEADRQMNEATIQFVHNAFEMRYPDRVDRCLLTPRCVMFCMKELEKKPSTPKSSKVVAEFFGVKKPWLELQEQCKQALSQRRESSFSHTTLSVFSDGESDE